MNAKTVFISYRRNPVGKAFAGRIFDSLKHHGYDVFLDSENMQSGNWKQQIFDEVVKRGHFIFVLTPDSLTLCSDSEDIVRLEYETALGSNRNIVPVKEETDDFYTYQNNCPMEMSSLFDNQGLELRHNSFRPDIEELIQKFIPPHKAQPPANANVIHNLPTRKGSSFSTALKYLANIFPSFIDHCLTLLVLASFIFVVLNDANYGNRDLSYFIVIAITLKGFWSIFSLPKEIRTVATVALVFVAFGSSILVGKFKSKGEFNDALSIIGFSTLTFGMGIATVVPSFRIHHRKINNK